MGDVVTLRTLEEAREAFLCSGTLPERVAGLVRPEIVASWTRCLRFGAAPNVPELPYDRDTGADHRLVQTAAPILEALAGTLPGEDVNILLCDHTSRILFRWSGTSTLGRRLDAINASPGFALDEAVVGTNGVGTVVEDGRPNLVTGAEHFADRLRGFACAGAPIRHPVTGRLLGVIDLTCPPERATGLLLALAVKTAASVEDALLQERSQRDRLLVSEFRAAVTRSAGAIVVLADDVYLQNRRAANLLEASDQALLGRYAQEVCVSGEAEDERLFPLASGAAAQVRIRRLAVGDHDLGVLVELNRTDPAPPGGHPARPPVPPPGTARSAAGRALAAEATAQMSTTLPLLVSGEPGTGKLELIRRMHPGSRLDVFDGALEALDGPAAWLTPVRESLRDPDVVVVLRHLDALSVGAARALAALLESAGTEAVRRVVGTVADVSDQNVPRALIDQFPLRLRVPPLRDRFEDIPALAAEIAAGQPGADRQHWTADVLRALCAYEWPGNVRELRSVVRSVAATGRRGDLTVGDLPAEVRQATRSAHHTALEQIERNAIVDALRAAHGNRAAAAKALGIGRATLYRKLTRFAIDA